MADEGRGIAPEHLGQLFRQPNRGVPSEGFWPKGSLPAQGRLPILGLLGVALVQLLRGI